MQQRVCRRLALEREREHTSEGQAGQEVVGSQPQQ